MIRVLLNRRRWHDRDLHTLRITVRHRGAPNDTRIVYGADIVDICAHGVLLTGDGTPEESDGAYIPYHRMLSIRAESGVLWSRRETS